MKVTGTASLGAPRAAVWQALQDPGVLVRTIPGCRELRAMAGDSYEMTVTAGVASIKGTYVGTVRLADQSPPDSYTLHASGQGAPGTVHAEARVRLSDAAGGGTLLEYDADAVVGGMIGGVGQRVLAGVAKKTAGEFFAAVDRYLVEGTTTPAAVAPAEAGAPIPSAREPDAEAAAAQPAGAVFRAPGGRPAETAGATPLAPFAAGAACALLGVLLGWLLGRRR